MIPFCSTPSAGVQWVVPCSLLVYIFMGEPLVAYGRFLTHWKLAGTLEADRKLLDVMNHDQGFGTITRNGDVKL
jgi:hypothetical protein